MNFPFPFDWTAFWNGKATSQTDFQATGRGLMDAVGFLYILHEISGHLRFSSEDILADVGCGAGIISLALASRVKHVHASDISEKLVERAQGNLQGIENVEVKVGSILSIDLPDSACDKVLVYSVCQYLKGEEEVGTALSEVFRILRPGGRALIAANPDPSRRQALVDVVMARDDKEAAAFELKLQESILWLDGDRFRDMASAIGFSGHVGALHPRIWQHFYMFDLILEKPKLVRS